VAAGVVLAVATNIFPNRCQRIQRFMLLPGYGWIPNRKRVFQLAPAISATHVNTLERENPAIL